MVSLQELYRQVFSEELVTDRPKRKYLKDMDRGANGANINMVARGDTKLGYHDDIESRKGDLVRELVDNAEANPHKRQYLTQKEALAILTFYNLAMSKEPKQINSLKPMFLAFDEKHNLFFLLYKPNA